MKTKLHSVLIIAMIFFTFSSNAQNSLWNRIENTKDEKVVKRLNLNLADTQTFLLNKSEFDNITTSTTLRKNKGKEKWNGNQK